MTDEDDDPLDGDLFPSSERIDEEEETLPAPDEDDRDLDGTDAEAETDIERPDVFEEDLPDEYNPRTTGAGTEDPPELDGETAGPLDDVARRVREEDDGGEYDDLFDEYDTAELDSEELWEQITSDEPAGTDLDATGEPHERVVKKSSYCEGCEFFSDPPEMHCTHEGTEIVELTDMESVRLRNCPIVEKEERLETIGDTGE